MRGARCGVHFVMILLFCSVATCFELFRMSEYRDLSVKDTISEGYGRRRYKPEYVWYHVFSQASCDETLYHIETLIVICSDIPDFFAFIPEYNFPGKK